MTPNLRLGPVRAERNELYEAHDRLLFGSQESSPVMWIGKPGDTVLVKTKSKKMTGSGLDPNTAMVARGKRSKDDRQQNT